MMAILRAPELSATSRIDRIWIMALLLRLVGRAGLVGQVGNSPAFLALPALPYPPCLPYLPCLPYPPSRSALRRGKPALRALLRPQAPCGAPVSASIVSAG